MQVTKHISTEPIFNMAKVRLLAASLSLRVHVSAQRRGATAGVMPAPKGCWSENTLSFRVMQGDPWPAGSHLANGC